MSDANLQIVIQLLNKWWQEEHIPDEMLMARVILIYKKGNTSKMENH